MNSITIHGLDDQLKSRIKRRAEAEGTSMNKTIKKLLEEAVGLRPRTKGRNYEHFKEFSGTWSENDVEEFEKATAELRDVEEKEWQ